MKKEILAKLKEIEQKKTAAEWLDQVIHHIGKTEDGTESYALAYVRNDGTTNTVLSGYNGLDTTLVEKLTAVLVEYKEQCDKDIEEL